MRYIYQQVVQDGSGNAIDEGSVTVYLAGTSTKATIYAAYSGGSADADSIIETGSDGTFNFYVDEDDYSHYQQFKAVMYKTGYTSETWDYLQIFPTFERTLLTDSSVDQGNNSIVGTLAWHIADASGSNATIIGKPATYDLTTNTTIPVTMEYRPEIGAVFDGSGTLTISSSFSPGRYQVFDDDFVVEGLSFAYPEWFGAAADPSTPTDDRTEFNSAFTSISSFGGQVIIDEKSQYYIASSITMPAGCSLIGNSGLPKIPREGTEWELRGSLIYLNSAATITVSEGGAISGINFIRYGITTPTDKAGVDLFAGTAIKIADNGHHA